MACRIDLRRIEWSWGLRRIGVSFGGVETYDWARLSRGTGVHWHVGRIATF